MSQFVSMREGLEKTFAENKLEPLIGRLFDDDARWLSYNQVGLRVKALAFAINALNPSKDFVAIAGENSVEWIVSDLACSGLLTPSCGLHHQWDEEKMYKVLSLTHAVMILVTSNDHLTTILKMLETHSTSLSIRHVILLDPSPSSNLLFDATLTGRANINIWFCVEEEEEEGEEANRGGMGSEEEGTILVSSLVGLCRRVSESTKVAQFQLNGDKNLFPLPDLAWVEQAAAAASATADSMFHPLASPSDVVEAAKSTSMNSRYKGAVSWLVAAEQGIAEASFDINTIWSVMFATGSSGVLKGVPTSRAGWASGASCNGPKSLGPGLEGTRVISHSALSHGLDRGIVWKAIYVGGSIGMARKGHTHEDVLEALLVFKPDVFVTMPSFFTRLYFDLVNEATQLQHQLLLRSALSSSSPSRIRELAKEQARIASKLVKETAMQGINSGYFAESMLVRPSGSFVHAFQEVSRKFSNIVVGSKMCQKVTYGSGGAHITENVLNYFNLIALFGGFSDFFGATEVIYKKYSYMTMTEQIIFLIYDINELL